MTRSRVPRTFAIDLRALAAFRIGCALVTLCDLGYRASHLVEQYSDTGLFPRSLFRESAAAQWSAYFLSGSSA